MSEIEVPLEKVQEDIQEAAHAGDRRTGRAAVTSALLAVIAAISALLAGHHANEAMIEQINAANAWNYYQAKGIKLAIAELKASRDGGELAAKKIDQYHHDQERIRAEAEEKQAAASRNLARHQYFAAAVTFFQIGIALIAIALLTKRGRYQLFSWALAAGGVLFFVVGLLR